jgi:hypothetical protein
MFADLTAILASQIGGSQNGGLQNPYQPMTRIPQMPGRNTQSREQIPRRGEPQMPQSTPQQGMPQMGMNRPGMGMGSQGLFNAYMAQLFNRRYAPPPMQGGVQNMGGFMGFASPKMSPIQGPQQGGLMSQGPAPGSPQYGVGGSNWWDQGMSTGA